MPVTSKFAVLQTAIAQRFSATLIIFILFSCTAKAGKISGIITDDMGNVLSYASILVKGTTTGTTANDAGKYVLTLDSGEYTLVCQYVGYERAEQRVTVGVENTVINFRLSLLKTSMKEVVVKPGGEDPAYEIIRQAIAKRSYYLDQVKEFQCRVYIKGQLKLRDFPDRFLGSDIDFEDGDSSKLKMLYLAETISTYSVKKPGKVKIEVTSTRVSGQSDAFGLSQPQIISLYENNVQIGRNLNRRGFVSPIADNALSYYRYALEGVFFEDGTEINKIRVTPIRKYEPAFTGVITITENDWRIHSVLLQLTRQSQMDFVDTIRLEQLYVPLNKDVWVIKNQVIYPSIKFFGFDAYGSFVNLYSDFNINPGFPEKFFDNVYLRYTDSSNKYSRAYWDAIRPIPLETEEVVDYRKKDSLERIRKSPRYLDSLDRKRNRIQAVGLLVTGQTLGRQSKRMTYSFNSLADAVDYNTAEGWVLHSQVTVKKRLDSARFRQNSVYITPRLRYGFSNKHFNAGMEAGIDFGGKYASSFVASLGKDVFQFNNSNPINPKSNSITTLFLEKNLMKTYEAWYGKGQFEKELGQGVRLKAGAEFQDRMPLNNTTTFKFFDIDKREFSPNYPMGLINENIKRHQAFAAFGGISWQPGTRYIEFPGRRESMGSKYPRFELEYSKGIEGVFGSDVDFDKWRLIVRNDINLKLAGEFNYKATMGGFLNWNKVPVPDYQHFNGNQSIFAGRYLNSFQRAPFYLNSTISNWYTTFHAEHHFNGLLTNKIPGFKRLNWHLVAGTNAFYVNPNNNYIEAFFGFENIFRLFRIDFIQSFSAKRKPLSGITLGMKGALFGN